METYHFVTNWTFEASIDRVWQKIVDVEAYPDLWSSIKRATIRGPEPKVQIGSVVDFALKGSLPMLLNFSTEFITFQPSNLIELKSSGDLMGHGKVVLGCQTGGTEFTFYWDVGLTNPLLNLLGKVPFLKSIMEKSHNEVMAIAYGVLKSSLEEHDMTTPSKK